MSNQDQDQAIVKASIQKFNISNKLLLPVVGVIAGSIIMFAFLAGSPIHATTDDIPKEVQMAEATYQTTLATHNLNKEIKAQAVIAEMESGAANCFAWKTLAYAKYNAGMEISTPIQDVEHTLCLAADFK
jgi:hypothetical protein